MVLGKKVAIFDWEWGQNLAPRGGQKIPWCCVLEQDPFNTLCLVLVQPRKTGKYPDMTEKLLTGMFSINTNKNL